MWLVVKWHDNRANEMRGEWTATLAMWRAKSKTKSLATKLKDDKKKYQIARESQQLDMK